MGVQARTRVCNKPPLLGDQCYGHSIENRLCITGPCTVDGKWSIWSTWATCDVSCGNGTRTRHRSCTNLSPEYGGLDCAGNITDYKTCHGDPCPVHGHWGKWEQWGQCSKTCGLGLQARTRACNNPPPHLVGDHCYGHNIENRLCNPGPCTDGGWSDWATWSNCSVECGGGFRTRSRTCTNPPPSPYGRDCIGIPYEISSCGNIGCATDCYALYHDYGKRTDGIYTIQTWKTGTRINVYCDMTTNGGGWTVFQRRLTGSVDFYRSFAEYENGFGNLTTEFWLGLHFIQELAEHGQSYLRVDLEAGNGTKGFEEIDNFHLSPAPAYTLHVGNTTDAIKIAKTYGFAEGHNGMNFSTHEHDVDAWSGNCVEYRHGGWWFNRCFNANLNGQYLEPGAHGGNGIVYSSFLNDTSLLSCSLMLRKR